MEIWEERYTDSKGKKESNNAFELFQYYLGMFPRNHKKLCQEVYFPDKKLEKTLINSKEFKKKLNTIYNYSTRFDWKKRCKEYNKKVGPEKLEELERFKTDMAIKCVKNAGESILYYDKKKVENEKRKTEKVVVNDELVERERRPNEVADTDLKIEKGKNLAVNNFFIIANRGVDKVETDNRHEFDEPDGLKRFAEVFHQEKD